MEYENYMFLNKNNVQYQRPNSTMIKSLKYSNQRGISASAKNIFMNLYNTKQKFQFTNNINQKNNSNSFFSNNEYFCDKEKLFDKCMKLQNEINNLNQKYKFQKVENKKQSKLIKKQNVLLNKFKIPINLFNDKLFESENQDFNNELFGYSHQNKFHNFEKINLKKRSNSNISEEKENSNRKSLMKTQSEFYLTQNIINEDKMNQQNQINFLGETLISNLKIRCKELSKEKKEKDDLIKDMKKNMKLSNLNELQKENSIYEKEMNKIKDKLFEAYDKIKFYEKKENHMKLLLEQLKKKDKKINILEQENIKIMNIYQNQIFELRKENELKNRKILNQNNLIKKLSMSNISNSKRESLEKDENEIKEITNMNEKINEILLNEELIELRENKNNNINLNLKYKGIEELYHLYIEMKKKGIDTPQNFFSYSLNTLSENYSNDENIIIYADGLIRLLNIKTKEERSIILDYANLFFKNLKNINSLKEKQTIIMNQLFNEQKYLENEKTIGKIISKLDQDKGKDIFDKYDLNRNGIITFENMRKAIFELNLSEIEEEILLLTKDNEIFNCMKYFEILYRINNDNLKDDKEEENVKDKYKFETDENEDINGTNEKNQNKNHFDNILQKEENNLEKKKEEKNLEEKKEEKNLEEKKEENNSEEEKKENNLADEKEKNLEEEKEENNLEEKKEEKNLGEEKEKSLEEEYNLVEEDEMEKVSIKKNLDEENNLIEKLKELSEKIKKENKSPSEFFLTLQKKEIHLDENTKIIGFKLEDLNEFFNKEEIKLNNQEKEQLKDMFKNEKINEENMLDFSLLEKYILEKTNNSS